MKWILIGLITLTLTSFTSINKPSFGQSSKWVITQNSSLTVNGSTNVNKFSCVILQYPKMDTVTISEDKTSNITLTGKLNIEVKNFDCSNYMMTKELRKTLNEKQFPYINIKFLSLKEVMGTKQKYSNIKGLVAIEIAGVEKRFEIFYQFNIDKNKMMLMGSQSINFSDFSLLPPKKMGKLIMAKDQLVVVFHLKLEAV